MFERAALGSISFGQSPYKYSGVDKSVIRKMKIVRRRPNPGAEILRG
jgi:hypothetical protein